MNVRCTKMGSWGTLLFSNDIACDIKNTYTHFLEQQLSNEEAYHNTLIEYEEIIGTDEEPFLWYSLADIQWDVGRLLPEVKNKALKFINENGGISFWITNQQNLHQWEKELQNLKIKLESPMPPEKRFRKPINTIHNPWNIGDVYAYQFHTRKAAQCKLLNKYILFQKIGDVHYYDDIIFSVVQIFDMVFDIIPTMDSVKNIRILPLISPPQIDGMPSTTNDYIPSFGWYMKATMICEKKECYPTQHFTFIGNEPLQRYEYEANKMTDFFLEKNGMEKWLIDYYLSWQNVKY